MPRKYPLWRDRFDKKLTNRGDKVILTIGRDKFTLRQMYESEFWSPQGASRLNKGIVKLNPRSVKELARRATIDDLFDVPGIGPVAVLAFTHALDMVGIHPTEWLPAQNKVSTIYAKAKPAQRPKRKKKKRR